ncbi:hypothetical protein JCM10212_000399 [Sporobolomyces blumeae]
MPERKKPAPSPWGRRASSSASASASARSSIRLQALPPLFSSESTFASTLSLSRSPSPSPSSNSRQRYPSPPGSVSSVSTCASFDAVSLSSSGGSPPLSPSSPPTSRSPSPTSPTFASYPPRKDNKLLPPRDYSTPPPQALYFHQRVHSQPKPLSRTEQWKLWYAGNTASSTLEPWENLLVHFLLVLFLVVAYLALTRLSTIASFGRMVERVRFYGTGYTPVEGVGSPSFGS